MTYIKTGISNDLEWRTFFEAETAADVHHAWESREVRDEDGSLWAYREPAVTVSVDSGRVSLGVDRFTRAHDSIQPRDNAKHLMLSHSVLEVPDTDCLWVRSSVAAWRTEARPTESMHLGFATFNMVDFTTGLVFDFAVWNGQVAIIHERMSQPRPEFCYVVHTPFHTAVKNPEESFEVAVGLDARERTVRYFVDEALVFTSPPLPVRPSSLRVGMGLFTCCPLDVNGSWSVQGQGMRGTWGPVLTADGA